MSSETGLIEQGLTAELVSCADSRGHRADRRPLADEALRHIVFSKPDPGRAPSRRPGGPAPALAPGRSRDVPAPTDLDAHAQLPLDPTWTRFYERLFQLRRLDARRYRPAVLDRRKYACLRALRASGPAPALRLAEGDSGALERGLRAVLIGVTCFWRDPPVFEALDGLLPGLLQQNPGGFRVLSLGCSDGAELYTVAILLAERGALDSAYLLGIDCCEDALRMARTGSYDPAHLQLLPPTLRERYFARTADGRAGTLEIAAAPRMACHWQLGDVFDLPPMQPYQLVLCRNLAIYLTPEAGHRLWSTLEERLAPGGVLVVGKAERPPALLGLERLAPCVYRKPAGHR